MITCLYIFVLCKMIFGFITDTRIYILHTYINIYNILTILIVVNMISDISKYRTRNAIMIS